MASATSQHKAGKDKPALRIKRPAPATRDPVLIDYLLFFACIPIAMAFLFSLVGTRLTTGMPYLDSLGYLTVHMFIAWWIVGLCAYLIKLMFTSWQPPVIAVCVIGYFLSIVPAAFTYQGVGEFFANIYPVFAANRADDNLPNWGMAYLFHFVRYSIPALPLFLGGVYGYRYVTGVDWYGYPSEESFKTDAGEATSVLGHATAGLIEGTKLPEDALLLAIKAE
ncbi:MAG: hypothetical protein ACR2QG_01640, partial [Gammaproteobacteria bacterium]